MGTLSGSSYLLHRSEAQQPPNKSTSLLTAVEERLGKEPYSVLHV
jgi:hypothetical protein